MKRQSDSWIKRQPVLAFYVFTFTITLLSWVPYALYSHGLFPFTNSLLFQIGGIGPLLGALIVLHALHGKDDGRILFAPLARWRIGAVWYLVAIFGSVVVMFVTGALNKDLGSQLARITPSLALLLTFGKYFVAAIPEEVAWRGFVLPRLQNRYGALVSSLIIGFFWALWHIPLLFVKDTVMATYPLVPYLIGIVASSILYTWLFNNSNGSVLAVTILHAVSNTVGPNAGVSYTIVVVLLALIVVGLFDHRTLSRAPRGETQSLAG